MTCNVSNARHQLYRSYLNDSLKGIWKSCKIWDWFNCEEQNCLRALCGADAEPIFSRMKSIAQKRHDELHKHEQFFKMKTEAGLKIDPETATITFKWVDTGDPYNLFYEPDEYCVGRCYFASGPEIDEWVSFYDLPAQTRTAIERKMSEGAYNDSDDDVPF